MLHSARSLRSVVVSSVIALSLGANVASAQVGHLPSKSPYEDVKVGQDFTFLFGYFNADVGAAGVLPKSSAFGGVRYDVPIGGPGYLTARYVLIPSQRNFLLPSKPRTTRILGTEDTKTHVADIGFTIALTGRKTWHRILPAISVGTGIASDFAKADTGGYKFGTKFGFTGGGSVRYVLRNGLSVRAEATNYLWRNSYPDSYFAASSDTTRVLTDTRKKKSWGGTWAYSLGLVFPIFR
ncbi:MAG: hypothetical protein ABI120_10570 [Gemmatimonadaceae bacterium]